jgi:Putative adhesin
MWRLALAALGMSCLLPAVETPGQKERLQQTKTERMDFPTGGLLRLNGLSGDLTIEGWDQPGLEITTTKTTKEEYDSSTREKGVAELDQVRLASERHGDELVVTTIVPRHGRFKPPLPRSTRVDLVSHIYVPQSARLAVDHGSGNLYIEDVAGGIEAAIGQGTILLRLPEQGQYDIDARSKWGSVTSDFPGQTHKTRWQVGHQLVGHAEGSAQQLHLRAGYGDIIVLKERKPKGPEAKAP